jgi:hypothetical protein
MTPVVRTLLSSLLLTGLTMPSLAWQAGFEDVIRNLRNPDPKARLSAVRMLRESQHTSAAIPVAAVVNDPIDDSARGDRRRAVVLPRPDATSEAGRVRGRSGQAVQAFEQPLAAWPRPVCRRSSTRSSRRRRESRVRIEAIYALGARRGRR